MKKGDVMNTEEAIKFLLNRSGYACDMDDMKIDEIILLLQQGEKYKKMWEELYEVASEFNFFPLMDKLKQKVFPEGGEGQ